MPRRLKDVLEEELKYASSSIKAIAEHWTTMLHSELAVAVSCSLLSLKKIHVDSKKYHRWITANIFDGVLPDFLSLSADLADSVRRLNDVMHDKYISPRLGFDDEDDVDSYLGDEVVTYNINKLTKGNGIYGISQVALLNMKDVLAEITMLCQKIDETLHEIHDFPLMACADSDTLKSYMSKIEDNYYNKKWMKEDVEIFVSKVRSEIDDDAYDYDPQNKKIEDYKNVKQLYKHNKPLLSKQGDLLAYLIENREQVGERDLLEYFKYENSIRMLNERIGRFRLEGPSRSGLFVNQAAEELVKSMSVFFQRYCKIEKKYHAATMLMALQDLGLVANNDKIGTEWRNFVNNEIEILDDEIKDNSSITKVTSMLLGKKFCTLAQNDYGKTNFNEDDFRKHEAVYKAVVDLLNIVLRYDLVNDKGFNEYWITDMPMSASWEDLKNTIDNIDILVSVIKGERPLF